MDYKIIVLFIMLILFIALWLIVFFKGQNKIVNRTFNIFVINMAIWSFGLAMFYKSSDMKASLFWTDVLYLAGSLIPAAFLLLSFVFPSEESTISHFRQILIFAPNVILFGLFFFTPIIVKEVAIVNGAKGFIYGPGHIIWDLQFDTMFTWAFIRFIKKYRHYTGLAKTRLRYVIMGTLVGVILAGVTNVIMPWFNRFELLWLGPPLTLTWLICIVYGIVKYRLMDINVALTRVGIFTIVYVFVLGIPFFAGYKYDLWQVATWIMLFLATSGPFIYLYLQRRAEDALLRDQRRYQETLRKASKGMTLIKDLNKLLKLIVHILTKTIRIVYAGIYLYDEKKEVFILKMSRGGEARNTIANISKNSPFIRCLFQIKNPVPIEDMKNINNLKNIEEDDVNEAINLARDMHATLAIPSFVEDEMLGFLVLGDKISGHSYTDDDLAVLSILTNQAALAIENAEFYERAKIAEAERIQSEKFATIGRLATSAKHEINNPLQMISWSFQHMSMVLKDTKDNYKNIRERLNETINNTKEMIAKLTQRKNVLAPDVLNSLDKISALFDRTFSILERKGADDAEFVNSINEFCAGIDNVQKELLKASEGLKDKNAKEAIEEIIHFSGSVSKNMEKARDIYNVLRSSIETGEENAKRIENQTQIMHDLPRRLDTELTAIDIDKLLEASFSFARQQTYWENLSDTPIEKHIAKGLPKIKGYFSRLLVVFLNLTMNAYQAMTDAGLKTSWDRLIKVTATVDDPTEPSFVEIHFANKGPLIPDANLERIFERGFTTKKDGSGLGLHISRIQVEINKGTIYARNINGFGPEFVIRLPIWKEGVENETKASDN